MPTEEATPVATEEPAEEVAAEATEVPTEEATPAATEEPTEEAPALSMPGDLPGTGIALSSGATTLPVVGLVLVGLFLGAFLTRRRPE